MFICGLKRQNDLSICVQLVTVQLARVPTFEFACGCARVSVHVHVQGCMKKSLKRCHIVKSFEPQSALTDMHALNDAVGNPKIGSKVFLKTNLHTDFSKLKLPYVNELATA